MHSIYEVQWEISACFCFAIVHIFCMVASPVIDASCFLMIFVIQLQICLFDNGLSIMGYHQFFIGWIVRHVISGPYSLRRLSFEEKNGQWKCQTIRFFYMRW